MSTPARSRCYVCGRAGPSRTKTVFRRTREVCRRCVGGVLTFSLGKPGWNVVDRETGRSLSARHPKAEALLAARG